MILSRKSMMTSTLFLVWFFWMIPFGYFEGILNADTTARQGGLYLIANIVAASVLILVYPAKPKSSFPGIRVYAMMAVWLLVIHVFQQDYFTSIKKLSNILLTQVLLILLANYAWKISLYRLSELFIYYIAITMVIVLYVHLTKTGPIGFGTHMEEFRMGGIYTFGQAATLAGMALLLCIHQILYNPDAKKYILIALSGFFMFCLVACDLRTAIGACAVALSVQYLFYLRSKRKSIFPFLVMASFLYGGYKIYVALNDSGTMVKSDLEYRELIWQIAISGILRHPIVGYGSVTTFFKHNPTALAFHEFLIDPHSSFLALMLQSGVVTFILLIVFLFQVGRFNYRSASFHTKALISVIIYWMIVGSTGWLCVRP